MMTAAVKSRVGRMGDMMVERRLEGDETKRQRRKHKRKFNTARCRVAICVNLVNSRPSGEFVIADRDEAVVGQDRVHCQ